MTIVAVAPIRILSSCRVLVSITVVPGDYSYESGAKGLLELKSKLGKLPDAVVCANDVMAIGCMDAARYRLGVKVPEDLSVVGFDGVGPAQWQSYDLTTVRQPVRRMTEAAVSMILERVEQPNLPPASIGVSDCCE